MLQPNFNVMHEWQSFILLNGNKNQQQQQQQQQ
jgi:hypothetical protein